MASPNSVQKFIHRFLTLAPVSAILSRILHRADSFMLWLTRGRHTFAELVGLPVAQLTMKGAKTGKQRILPLVSLPVHEKFILIATNFGQKHNPSWYYNLKANPECNVLFNGRSGTYIARELQGEDYFHYWKLAGSYYSGYEKYKERASHRHIPIMLLEPKK